MKIVSAKKELKRYLNSTLSAYAEVLFIQNRAIGAVILAVTFVDLGIGLGALIGIVSALAFAAFVRMDPQFLESGFYIYNPLLVGMSVGFLFKISLLTIFLAIVASILAFLITIVMNSLLSSYGVPILSLPFATVSSVLYLASLNYSNLFYESLNNHAFLTVGEMCLPLWISSFFKSMGTIFFLPSVWVGAIFFSLLLLHSRIAAVLALGGYYFGVWIHSLLSGSYVNSLLNPYAFNYILVAAALGGIFLVPGIRSYLLSALGVAVSVVLVDATAIFWTLYKIPVFTLPFNLSVITFLFVLRLLKYREFAYVIKRTPENTLSYYLLSLFRFKSHESAVFLPFSGKWSVYQGFDDVWTHQGRWRYAYDFVIRDENGSSYAFDGSRLEDYYAYKKPVLSPVSGYVVETLSSLPDNPIGEVDNINNWGNYVIIYSTAGFYVEVSHLSQNSLKVKKGDFVEAGQIIGLCGNSGYSPEPHIHIQVQEGPHLGSKTMPFNFVAYTQKEEIKFYDRPEKGESISSFSSDKSLDSRLSFVLDSVYEFEVFKDMAKIDSFSLEVKMDRFSGRFFFEDERGNRLFFAKEYGVFYFYDYVGDDESYLKRIFMAVPRIALSGSRRVVWRDFLTPRIVHSGLKRALYMFLASFCYKPFLYGGVWEKEGNLIRGEIRGDKIFKSETVIDEVNGFASIRLDEILIRRKK